MAKSKPEETKAALFVLSGGGPVDGAYDAFPAGTVVSANATELHIPAPAAKVVAVYTRHDQTADQAFYHLARTEPL
jgi:hypothetical protein